MKKVLQKITKGAYNFIHRKERFLFACAYNFYFVLAKQETKEVSFLPFIHEKQRREWAKFKAQQFINFCKKNNCINQRYKLALNYAIENGIKH